MKKKIIALLLALTLILCPGISAFAEDVPAPDGEVTQDESFYEDYELFKYIYDYYLNNHVFQPDGEDVLLKIIERLLAEHPELTDELISYLMKSEDPYSYYFSEEEYQNYTTTPTYYGVGITVEYGDGYIWIVKVDSSSPAGKAGVRVGDYIYSVDGKLIAGMPYSDVMPLIRGEQNTTVKIGFYRPSEKRVFNTELVRSKLTTKSVSWHYTDNADGTQTGVIEISNFKSYMTYFSFVQFLQEATEAEIKNIIIDVRNNLGGSLSVCLDMINWLVPGKNKLICTVSTPSTGEKQKYYTTGRGLSFDNICVLVNEKSASATELFSKVLQEYKLATIIGHQTFGKAIGQSQVKQSDGSVISLSSFEILSPKGQRYNGVGVIPDIEAAAPFCEVPVYEFSYLNRQNYTDAKYLSENDAVYALEQRLVVLGYLESADRLFDMDTAQAIWSFQENNGLECNARLDAATLSRLTDIINLVKLIGNYNDEAMTKAAEVISK